jgi:hypothetical protein
MNLRLLLNRTTDELIVVTESTYAEVFATDNEWSCIEFMQQCTANSITIARIMRAFTEYINAGIQVDFLDEDQSKVKTSFFKKVKE